MMNAASLIFSNIHDSTIPEFTAVRTMASVPFAGRYRLIDFALSNVVNSGITRVGIITHYNYQSLVEHIGNGKDWDLARRTGGIKVLPPFITAFDNSVAAKVYETKGFQAFKLEIAVENGKIASVTCVEHNETPGFGADMLTDEALSVLVGQDIATAQIDVKSGVTMTSNGINDALAQAR